MERRPQREARSGDAEPMKRGAPRDSINSLRARRTGHEDQALVANADADYLSRGLRPRRRATRDADEGLEAWAGAGLARDLQVIDEGVAWLQTAKVIAAGPHRANLGLLDEQLRGGIQVNPVARLRGHLDLDIADLTGAAGRIDHFHDAALDGDGGVDCFAAGSGAEASAIGRQCGAFARN